LHDAGEGACSALLINSVADNLRNRLLFLSHA
jgi:hypothetical protein